MVAPRILWRYILRDVVLHTLLGLCVVTLVLVLANILRFVEELLAAGIGFGALLRLVSIIAPSYLAYAIPTSLVFGVLLSFGRMSGDGEIIAIRAAGISVPRLLPPVLLLGAGAALLTGYLNFDLEPTSRYRMKTVVRELGRSVKVLRTGTFSQLGTRTVYVAEEGDETCPYRGVLIGDLSSDPRPLYIAARCARIAESETPTGLALELLEGSIHLSESEAERYRRVRFERMSLEVDLSAYIQTARRAREHRFSELLALDARFRRGERPELRGRDDHLTVRTQIQRRVAFPMACLLLSVLAVPMGIRPLRTGRSAGALTAIGVMALYWCLFTAGEIAAQSRLVPPWLGVWAANTAVASLAAYLFRRTIRGDS